MGNYLAGFGGSSLDITRLSLNTVLHQFCSTLLIRISPILEFSGSVLLIITLIGSSTAFFAATCGLLQNDLKRIIAFSTISQLGYHIFICLLLIILLVFLFILNFP
jgi:NADH:ubiquinone oxidoreductase subunit 5 (subunit L)/multisubunit Na+/H+ antiporter MnhA subunit